MLEVSSLPLLSLSLHELLLLLHELLLLHDGLLSGTTSFTTFPLPNLLQAQTP